MLFFNEIPQVVQKIWKFFTSILTILDLLTFPCYKETNDVSTDNGKNFFTFNILQIGYLTIGKSYIDIRLLLLEIPSVRVCGVSKNVHCIQLGGGGGGWWRVESNWPSPRKKPLSKSPSLLGLRIEYISLNSCGTA